MRQLDLFGSVIESSPSPAGEKKVTVAPVEPPESSKKPGTSSSDFIIEQHSVLQNDSIAGNEIKKQVAQASSEDKETSEKEKTNPVFFTDGKIGVKIKAKPALKPETKAEPKPVIKTEAKATPASHLPKAQKEKKALQKRGRKSFKEIDAEVDLIEVPDDEILFQKQYYPISEVAGWFNVNTSLLRFWENEFEILKPRKNRKGDRMFRPEDVKNIHLIYQLLRQRKYSLEGAKEYLKSNKTAADTHLQLTQTLQKLKSFLLDLKANL